MSADLWPDDEFFDKIRHSVELWAEILALVPPENLAAVDERVAALLALNIEIQEELSGVHHQKQG